MAIEFLLLIYTVIPLPLYLCISFGSLYSVIYEILATLYLCDSGVCDIIGKFLLHLCIHLIGIQVFIMSQVRGHEKEREGERHCQTDRQTSNFQSDISSLTDLRREKIACFLACPSLL